MVADLLFVDEAALTVYRIVTKRLTVGGGIAVDSEQDALSKRDDLSGRALLNLLNLPLIVHGTASAETAALAALPDQDESGNWVLPEGLDWQPLAINEQSYLALDEYLCWSWIAAVKDKNSHRDSQYTALKKALSRARPAHSSGQPMIASETPDKHVETN